MDSSKWQAKRGKLFLPKLEYGKVKNSGSRQVQEYELENHGMVDDCINEKEKGHSETEYGGCSTTSRQNDNNRTMATFTKFSVLPPIPDKYPASRRSSRRTSQIRRPSAVNVKNDVFDTVRYGQEPALRRGSFLQQRKAVITNETQKDVLKYSNPSTLTIVGKRYIGLEKDSAVVHSEYYGGSGDCQKLQRPSSSPNAGVDQSFCTNCGGVLRKGYRHSTIIYSRNSGKITEETTPRFATRRGSYLRRFNSDTSPNGNPAPVESPTHSECTCRNNLNITHEREKANASNVKTNILLFPNSQTGGNSPRPLSRSNIDIDINMNEATIMDSEARLGRPQQRDVVHTESTSDLMNATLEAPMIEITADAYLESDLNSKRIYSPNNLEGGSQRLQLLIDSLDSAKEELPNGKLELPQTSVREKRRRSALCRVKSKQVDDFLLVHNLRDLGLL